jgi:signal transduction histidine kinase
MKAGISPKTRLAKGRGRGPGNSPPPTDRLSRWQWKCTPDLKFSELSPNFPILSAALPEAWLGKSLADMAGPEPAGSFADRRSFRGLVLRYHDFYNNVRTCLLDGAPSFDRRGRFQGFSGTASAIDPLDGMPNKQALVGAMESISEGFALYDLDDRLILFNTKYNFYTDRTLSRLRLGSRFSDIVSQATEERYFQCAERDPRGWMTRRLEYHSNPKGVFEVELRDGRWLQIVERRTPDGGLVTVNTDITAQKRRSESEQRAQTLQVLGQLTSGIAHDLSNLLLILDGNLHNIEGALRNGRDPLPQLGSCHSAVALANSVLQRLSVFTQRQPLNASAFDVRGLLIRLSEFLRRTIGSGIEIHVPSDRSRMVTFVDPNQLEIVLLNLSLNARDAMPNGGTLRFSVSKVDLDLEWTASHVDMTPGAYIRIEVADTGHGMTRDVAGRAFEPFFTTKESGKGTGLGLSMAYAFARQSGGAIEINSALGVGTKVFVYLPVYVEP